MDVLKKNNPEEEALDALIVWALRQGACNVGDPPWRNGSLPDVVGPEPVLSEEDRQALKALGADLVWVDPENRK